MSKIFLILDKKEKNLFYLFFFLSFFSLGFELIGISLILPFLDIITNSEKINFYTNKINSFFLLGLENNNLIFFFILTFFIIYTLKVIFITSYNFFLTKYIYDLKTNVSNKLFNFYLKKSYLTLKNTNSAELIRNLEDSRYIMYFIKSLLVLFVEILFFCGLVSLLLFLEPKITSIGFVFFGSISFIFYKLTQSKAGSWGDQRAIFDGKKIKSMMQAFGGIKEIKVLGKEKFFYEIYQINNFNSNYFSFKQDFILNLPKNWLEWLTIISLLCFVTIFISLNNTINDLIPLVGLYIVSVYRMIPSINKIASSLQTIKFCLPTIRPFLNEFEQTNQRTSKYNNKENLFLEFKDKLEIKNLNFYYNKNEGNILKNINFEINKGEFIGIEGKSGSGKTTLINLILGLYEPKSGEILVDKKSINKNITQWQNKIGYVPQNIYFTDDSIKNNIAFGVEENQIDNSKVIECLKITNLYEYVHTTESNINTNLGELGDRFSGGQKQRVGIARALYNDPEILILDEFTSFLDKDNEFKIASEVKNLRGKKTIIIISHNKEVLSQCDKILSLN